MRTFAFIIAAALTPVAAFAADVPVTAQMAASTNAATPVVGQMLYSTGGKKLAAVYKVDVSGAPQILLEGKLVTIPAATLSEVEGHVQTSLTKKDLMTRR